MASWRRIVSGNGYHYSNSLARRSASSRPATTFSVNMAFAIKRADQQVGVITINSTAPSISCLALLEE